jgi:hypothetical protein
MNKIFYSFGGGSNMDCMEIKPMVDVTDSETCKHITLLGRNYSKAKWILVKFIDLYLWNTTGTTAEASKSISGGVCSGD